MLVSASATHLAVEVRDAESMSAKVVGIDLGRGSIEDQIELPEAWWSVLTGFDGERLFIQSYPDSSNPENVIKQVSKGIWSDSEWIEIEQFPESIHHPNYTKPVKFPLHYPEEHGYFKEVKSFLEEKLSVSIERGCEYLEWSSFVTISYYICEQETWRNECITLHVSGEVLDRRILEKNVSGTGLDTFIVIDHLLVFSEHKSVLTGLLL